MWPARGRACGLRLACTAGLTFDKIALDRLPVFLQGSGELTMALYEQLLGNRVAMVRLPCCGDSRAAPPGQATPSDPGGDPPRSVSATNEALLPYGPRSFQGYRLLHEYFAMPERFLFVELGGLSPALRRCPGNEIDLFILFNRVNRVLEHRVDASLFALFCTPAANLFPKRADRIQIDNRQAEFQILPDRTRPLDYEPYQVTEVMGYGDGDKQQAFLPFYAALESCRRVGAARDRHGDSAAYYTLRRTHRTLSEQQRRWARAAVTSAASCTSRWSMPARRPSPTICGSFPCRCCARTATCRCRCRWGRAIPISRRRSARPFARPAAWSGPRVRGPRFRYGTGEAAWRLVNHLSLNYASLVNDPQRGGAAALREMLSLYADMAEPHVRKQIDGVQSVVARPVTRPVPTSGPLTFARGLQITLTCDESAFEGTGVFLLGAVLEEFFARYVSINSFTETVVRTLDRGEIMQWPIRIGRRQSL